MNNIRDIKREQFTELFEGLGGNTNLEELHLCNTGIGDLVAQVGYLGYLGYARTRSQVNS